MSNEEFVFSRNIPLEPGPKPASQSLPVTLPLDQPPLEITDATSLISDVKASIFGFPLVEQRQFLLQELPKYGIDETTWGNTGKVEYIPNFGTVQLDISQQNNEPFSVHQTKFAYKYQPGKQISISQAVQSKKGAAIANSFTQWGEYTKFDGYGWRLMTKKAEAVIPGSNTITAWHNYLFFFRRTSAVLPHLEGSDRQTKVTQCPCGIGISPAVGTPADVQIAQTRLYRPPYLVGTNGTITDYLGPDTWEELAAASMGPLPDAVLYNKDRFTGRFGEGAPDTSNTRSPLKSSAHEVSFVSDSYEISNCTGSGTTITCSTGVTIDGNFTRLLQPGMTVRGLGIPIGTVIVTAANGSITISKPISGSVGSTIWVNEETNLTMFLIQRSWYGGAGGRGLAYIPDRNAPFNGSTRWVTGHEIRIGDTLPVPSMSSPDMPITYLVGTRVGSGNNYNNRDSNLANVTLDSSFGINRLAFLRRFGVSVWIDGGDPRPAEIQSSSSTGKNVSNSGYTPLLAIGVKPFVWNKDVPLESGERPQKSRVYPITLQLTSTKNTEYYFVKNPTFNGGTIIVEQGEKWFAKKQDSDHLKVVASLSNFGTLGINNNFLATTSPGVTEPIGGKLIGAFYSGQNESTEVELTEIFDPQRELLGRAENLASTTVGDTLLIIARSLETGTPSIVSCSLIYAIQ